MEEPKNKYILLVDGLGSTIRRECLSKPHLLKGFVYTQLHRGELLEAHPRAKHSPVFHKISLVKIERNLACVLDCPTANVARLSNEEATLLLPISSNESRYRTFKDSKRLDFGRRLSTEDQVFVSVDGVKKDLPGVVRYKGELPPCHGTMFGVELIVGINSLIKGFFQ